MINEQSLPWNNIHFVRNRFRNARALARTLFLQLLVLEQLRMIEVTKGPPHTGFFGIVGLNQGFRIPSQHRNFFYSCLFPTASSLRPPPASKPCPNLTKYKTAFKHWKDHGFKERVESTWTLFSHSTKSADAPSRLPQLLLLKAEACVCVLEETIPLSMLLAFMLSPKQSTCVL